MAPRYVTIVACGPEHARRYCIMDDQHNYWNERDQTWTTNPKEAGLFVEEGDVTAMLRYLMVTQVQGILQRFIVPVVVELKGTEPVTAEALAEWLDTAVEISLSDPNGTGPGGAMVMMRMDCPQLAESSDE